MSWDHFRSHWHPWPGPCAGQGMDPEGGGPTWEPRQDSGQLSCTERKAALRPLGPLVCPICSQPFSPLTALPSWLERPLSLETQMIWPALVDHRLLESLSSGGPQGGLSTDFRMGGNVTGQPEVQVQSLALTVLPAQPLQVGQPLLQAGADPHHARWRGPSRGPKRPPCCPMEGELGASGAVAGRDPCPGKGPSPRAPPSPPPPRMAEEATSWPGRRQWGPWRRRRHLPRPHHCSA